jgi:hypothetical protein
MNTQTQSLDVFLTALAPSHEVRTARYSEATFKAFLEDRPTAITLASRGMFDVAELIGHSSELEALICHRRLVNRADGDITVITIEPNVALHVMHKSVQAILQETDWLMRKVLGKTFFALLPDFEATPDEEKKFQSIFRNLLAHSRHPFTSLPSAAPSARDIPKKERDRLIEVRRQMLDKVGSLTSDDLAAAAASTTTNASQYAADQRSAGAIFGVKFGKEWRYPAFQFNSKRHVRPEMKAVLAALTPDLQGWDRLHWFLAPHETLEGKTPLDLWKKSPLKVIEAAHTERWDGRD